MTQPRRRPLPVPLRGSCPPPAPHPPHSSVVEAVRLPLLPHRPCHLLLNPLPLLALLGLRVGRGHDVHTHAHLVHPLLQPVSAVLGRQLLHHPLRRLAPIPKRIAHARRRAFSFGLAVRVPARRQLGCARHRLGAPEAHVVGGRVLRIAHPRAAADPVIEAPIGRVEIRTSPEHALAGRLGEPRSRPLPYVAEHVVKPSLAGGEGVGRRQPREPVEPCVCPWEVALP
eukprot:scaffold6430_cov133-Isochrysis_galbana.AAC.5